MPAPRLILASASPRRRELLAEIWPDFSVLAALVEEHEHADADPRALVSHNAALKADWVADRHAECVVLGADTTVCVQGRVLNKPADLAEAAAMLRLLSGRTHEVYTAVALRQRARNFTWQDRVRTAVTFYPLTEAQIAAYLREVNPLDKAGAYAIQERGEWIVSEREGSLTNVVGLPLEETRAGLRLAGFPV